MYRHKLEDGVPDGQAEQLEHGVSNGRSNLTTTIAIQFIVNLLKLQTILPRESTNVTERRRNRRTRLVPKVSCSTWGAKTFMARSNSHMYCAMIAVVKSVCPLVTEIW